MQQNAALLDEAETIPPAAHKSFDVAIVYGPNSKTHPRSITDLTADDIGGLVMIKCIVVRAS